MLRPNWRLSVVALCSSLTEVCVAGAISATDRFYMKRGVVVLRRREAGTGAKRILASVLIASIVSGCAPFPSKSATGEREYRYRAPANVEENDRAECVARADSAATAAGLSLTYQTEEGVATVFGLFGALVGATAAMARTRAVAEDTYEQEMKACLKDKGYDLPK